MNLYKAKYDKNKLKTNILHLGVGRFARAHIFQYFAKLPVGVVGVSLQSQNTKYELQESNFDYWVWQRGDREEAQEVKILKDILVLEDDLESILGQVHDIDLITITVTESGYKLKFSDSIENPRTLPFLVARLLKERFIKSAKPLSILCCDDIPSNGTQLEETILSLINDKHLLKWIKENVSFPNTVVDRIVPATTDELRDQFEAKTGFYNRAIVATEQFSQWIIQDNIKNLKNELETSGVQIVKEIHGFEKAKIRLLCAAQSYLAYAGLQLGYIYVHEAINHGLIYDNVQAIWQEARQTVHIKDYNLDEYFKELLIRFKNPHLMHRLDQIAENGEQKIPIRLQATIDELTDKGIDGKSLVNAVMVYEKFRLKQ